VGVPPLEPRDEPRLQAQVGCAGEEITISSAGILGRFEALGCEDGFLLARLSGENAQAALAGARQ